MRGSVILPTIVALAGVAATAQSPQAPTFRSGADLVQIDVSVLDKDHRPVRGLTAADFIVKEEGHVRPVVGVGEVVQPPPVALASGPARHGWTSEIAPDIATNQMDPARLIVIVLDDALVLHEPRFAEAAKKVGRAVVARLTPQDRAAVVFTSNPAAAQGFTADRQRLLAAIATFTPRGQQRYNADWTTLADWNGSLASARTLSHIADYLANLPGPRKIVFYVSPGIQVNLKALAPTTDEAVIIDEIKGLLGKAPRSNVTLNAIDPGGLEGFAATVVDARSRSSADAGFVRDLEIQRQETLGAIAGSTGGRVVQHTDAFDDAVESIFSEYRSYYIVGFQSASARHDGKFRKIDIQVSRPGLTVLARGGYFAAEGGIPDKPTATGLEAAVNGWTANPGVPLQVAAAAFAAPARRSATVAVVLGVRHAVPKTGLQGVKAQMLLRAFTPEGKEVTSREVSADIAVRGGALPSVYYELLAPLDLPPGRYLLRLATDIDRHTRTGSVFHEITVPDFSAAPVSLSGIVLSTTPALHSAPRDAFAAILPVVPTANRQFPRNITVSAFGRVYQKNGQAPAAAAVTASIVDVTGRELARFEYPLAADRFAAGTGSDYNIDIPVATLAPGQYLLTVQAVIGTNTATQHLRFEID